LFSTVETLLNPAVRLVALYAPGPMVPDGTAWSGMASTGIKRLDLGRF